MWAQPPHTYTTPGNGTFKIPAGVTSLNVECWGAGGAGGGINNLLFGGGGGGGGAYTRSATFGVTPATTLNYKVGAGGVGANGADGPNGEITNFSTVIANGGAGGKNGASANGLGGAGGTSSGVGSFVGGNGLAGGTVGAIVQVLASGGGGGSAGPGPSGTGVIGNSANVTLLVIAGGAAVTGGGKGGDGMTLALGGAANSGNAPGGGGGGALGLLAGSYPGGNGGNGQIKINYTCPTYSFTGISAPDVCIPSGTTSLVKLTGVGLPVGDYVVSYNTNNPVASLTANATVSVAGTLEFTATGLNAPGLCKITVTRLTSESCFNNFSTANEVTINVYGASVGGSVSGGTTICTGNTSGTLSLSGHTGTIMKWQYAVAPFSVWTDILSATGTTYTSGILSQTTQFRAVVKNGVCNEQNSAFTTVTVNPVNAITLSSVVGTDVQSVCRNTAITNITYNTTGATGASFSGLPSGVSGGWAGNVVTISGIPTATGTFNYEITLTGGCGTVTKTGTITVRSRPVVSFITPAKAQTCAETHTTYVTQAGQSNYNWTVSGTVNVDYNLIARGTTNDFDIVIEWLTAGVKTITVNYDNSEGCNATTPVTFSTEVLVIDKGQVHGGKHICKEDAFPTLTLTSITGSNIPYPDPSLVLKWQYSDDNNNATWHDIAGTAGQVSYTPTSIPVSFRTYKVLLENVLTCAKESVETRINIDAFEVPTFGAITYPVCDALLGSVVINNLPEGNWALYQNGNFVTNGTGVTYTLTGLAGGIYTFTVTEGICTSNASVPLDINQPANIWDGTKWSKTGDATLPAADDKIVFEDSYIISTDMSGCSCTVNSGDIVVNSDKTLTITNAVNVNSGTLTFENNASLVQKNATVNSGNIIYKRTSTPMKNFDFTYWSSPVSGQTLYNLSPNTRWDKYLSFTGTVWREEQYGASVMASGIGYIIRTPAEGSWPNGEHVAFPYSQEVEFIGIPNNGNISGQSVTAGNYYLIGNPYPSAISADSFLFENSNNSSILDGTIYFWTHNTPVQIVGSQPAYSSSDYATYNGVGGTSTSPAPSGGNEPSGNIAAGQSFFALASANGTVAFNNTMRIQGDNNQFFKSVKEAKSSLLEKHRLWLNMTNKDGAFKQLLLGYVAGATNGYDGNFDGISFDGNAYIDFYSTNLGSNLAIQGRVLPFNDSDIVPLGYRTIIAGEFTISINKADGILSTQPVYLEDKLTHTIKDLSQSDYTFTTGKGVFNNRFVLRYTNKTLAADEFEQDNNSVVVWVDNKNLRLNSQGENMNKVSIYDISGKLIYNDSDISSSEVVISNLKFKNEVLLIKILLANNHIINKKIITSIK
ncbi:hypothetical protein DMB68_13945 [Flavobacterium hydrophilum]|uniref:Glycine-rich domain-containing protein n=2 Tax=Flavobacterium hydrophilum TaxID=2211445 RepID=A0A2V4CES9_9FLAO|nr:hypothetical protein DMB68_13945 [Flavobacterium hydrophilum]